MKGQKFPLTQIYHICDNPYDAKDFMVRINMAQVEALPLDQKEIILQLGDMFIKNAQNKILPHIIKPKISDKDRLIEAITELQDEKGIVSIDKVIKRLIALGVAEQKIEILIEGMKREAMLICINNQEDLFKFRG